MFRRRILTAVAVVMLTAPVLTSVAWTDHAAAAQTAVVGGNALKISPVRFDLTANPGTSQTIDVYVQNLSDVPASLHAAINDFVASGDESGRPNIILNENEYAPTHSLKRMVVPISDFTVAPNATKDVKVTIDVPKGMAGGGYYGAVRFYPAGQNGQTNVNLSGSVGSLILLKVNGNIKEDLSIASFDVRKNDKPGTFFMSDKGISVVARFKNSGNVQVEPFGKIVLKRFGKIISETEINNTTPRGSVLPDSIRRFTLSLDKLQPFGKYTLEGNFGYGDTGQLLSAETTFYVIPAVMLIAGGIGLLIVLFLIFVVPRMIRSYNRRIISRASRRRR